MELQGRHRHAIPKWLAGGTGMALLSYAVALILILAMTWPWARHFSGFLLDHWDPPFHAWKLELMANRILRGDLFFWGSADTNLVYPHGGALYFDALHWPCSVVYALVRAWTPLAPEAIYQWILVAFWALTAPCFFPLLRRLGASQTASLFGSVAFCVIPYRISYVNEFQMQLTFLIPLFYLGLLRFLERESIGSAILLAFCWWAFAVTELYQAVFILFTVPFVVLARLAGDPSPLGRRRFWISATAGVVSEVAFVFVLLFPYFAAKQSGGGDRDLKVIIHHSIQPLSYFVPFGRHSLWNLDAKVEEFIAYPTLVLYLLPLLLAAVWMVRAIRRKEAPRQRLLLLTAPLALSFLAFWAVTAFLQLSPGPRHRTALVWQGLAVLTCLSAVALCFAPGRSERTRFLLGLAAASVYCFFLSLGPTMALQSHARPSVWNPVYMGTFRVFPLLAGFRAACRFGVFVHFFLVCCAALALDELIRMAARLPLRGLARASCVALPVIALLAIVAEAYPPEDFLRFRKVEKLDSLPVVRHLAKEKEPFCLAVLPMENRALEARAQFSLLKDRFLSVSGWCGCVPAFNAALSRHMRRGDVERAGAEMLEFWPPCHVLIDKGNPVVPSPSYMAARPDLVGRSQSGVFLDYAAAFAADWEREKEDSRYLFLRQKKKAHPGVKFTRRFRHDFAKEYPYALIRLRGGVDTLVHVRFNQRELCRMVLGSDEHDSVVPLPAEAIVTFGENLVVIEASEPVELVEFRLLKNPPQDGEP